MKCVDLFAGCGGLSLGFINAGIEVVAAIDNWDKSVEVYNDNFDHTCYLHDLTDEKGAIEIINKYKPHMIAGGPPCQDFSSAGKRDETLGRADLTYHLQILYVHISQSGLLWKMSSESKKVAFLPMS